jgi:hypothetical protein
MAASGVPGSLACGGFGFAATRSPATFDIFHWVQIANYGLFYILFDSAPSGSNHIDVWELFLHLKIASPNYLVATF